MEGYQVLPNKFFYLSTVREVKGVTQLLLIFLRGFYHWKREPIFYISDSQIIRALGISRFLVRRARKELVAKGFIKYEPGVYKTRASQYTMLDTVLAPKLIHRGKYRTERGKSVTPLPPPQRGKSVYNTSNRNKTSKNTSKEFHSLNDLLGTVPNVDISRLANDREAITRVHRGLK